MLNPPLTVRDQFEAVVSNVPVKPVMSMLAMVVAAASVVVPVGLALKMALFVATGVHPHAAAPVPVTAVGAVFSRMARTEKASSPPTGEILIVGFVDVALFDVPPVVGAVVETPRKRTVAQMCFAVPADKVAVMVWVPAGSA